MDFESLLANTSNDRGYAKAACFVSQFGDLFTGIPYLLPLFPFFGQIFTAYYSFGGKETLHENEVMLVPLVDGGVAFSRSVGILTTLVCLQAFAERVELSVS